MCIKSTATLFFILWVGGCDGNLASPLQQRATECSSEKSLEESVCKAEAPQTQKNKERSKQDRKGEEK